ncbi:MAG: hypothetical protein ABIA92_00235 [Patescibacteria group bacterium]
MVSGKVEEMAILCYNAEIMPQKNTQSLQGLIQHSQLLSDDRKEALLRVLPQLSDEQIDHLKKLIVAGNTIKGDIAEHAVSVAVNEQDDSYLSELSSFLQESNRTLRKEEENAERTQESADSDSFFDATA